MHRFITIKAVCRQGIYIHIALSCAGYKGMDASLEPINVVCQAESNILFTHRFYGHSFIKKILHTCDSVGAYVKQAGVLSGILCLIS